MSDDIESWFERGVTDGLPVVPPTRERVERMLAATSRGRHEVVALVPPNYGRASVEKLAANAVMAGCRPEYFPVVLAVAEAACDPTFNLHGHSGTTNAASPLIVINGPIRARLGVNCRAGVFGPGFRANATIGRALRLIMINLGGTRPGETSMSTLGHPGRYTYCIGEYEEVSPWEPLHVEAGFGPEASTVTLFAGESPVMINDHLSRDPVQLVASLGWSAAGIWNHKTFPLYGHVLWVIGPEHARAIGEAGWSKRDVKQYLFETIRRPAARLMPGADGAETGRLVGWGASKGPPEPPERSSRPGEPGARLGDVLVPKFPSVEEIMVVVAGGTAGRFSAVVPGWMGGEMGSRPITRAIKEEGASEENGGPFRGPPCSQ